MPFLPSPARELALQVVTGSSASTPPVGQERRERDRHPAAIPIGVPCGNALESCPPPRWGRTVTGRLRCLPGLAGQTSRCGLPGGYSRSTPVPGGPAVFWDVGQEPSAASLPGACRPDVVRRRGCLRRSRARVRDCIVGLVICAHNLCRFVYRLPRSTAGLRCGNGTATKHKQPSAGILDGLGRLRARQLNAVRLVHRHVSLTGCREVGVAVSETWVRQGKVGLHGTSGSAHTQSLGPIWPGVFMRSTSRRSNGQWCPVCRGRRSGRSDMDRHQPGKRRPGALTTSGLARG